MPRKTQLEAVYGYGVHNQFKEIKDETITCVKWYATEKAVGAGAHSMLLLDESRLAIDYLRSKLGFGVTFSVSVDVLNNVVTRVGEKSATAESPPRVDGIVMELTDAMQVKVALPRPDICARIVNATRSFRVVKEDPPQAVCHANWWFGEARWVNPCHGGG